jgi:LacI family transcriptional regulator
VDRLLTGEPFTGLFITNHEGVFGALPELMRNRVSVPDELSLVCYEDVPLFDCWHPPITVVDNAPAEMARAAFDLLIRQIEGHALASDDQVIRIRPRFKVRESCTVPRASEVGSVIG